MRTHGFSLIELSIVLVILGLLVGGILAGQSLIKASEMRSISQEYSQYVTSIRAFQDKYQGMPGDFMNATLFWGRNPAKCAAAAGADATNGTCNGDGNGLVTLSSSGGATGTQEAYQIWHQLELAGLIGGTYTGYSAGTNYGNAIGGVNIPLAKARGAVWASRNGYDNGNLFNYRFNENHFEIGLTGTNINWRWPTGNFLSPEEAWNIDTKLDDGRATIGRVRSARWSGCTDATDVNDTDAEYDLTNGDVACFLVMKWG